MKTKSLSCLTLLALSFTTPMLAADAAATVVPTWHAQTLTGAIGYVVLFTAIGVALAIAGYKLFDQCTPGDLHKEIVENKNVAAAIVAAAVILGVCIIIAASMLG